MDNIPTGYWTNLRRQDCSNSHRVAIESHEVDNEGLPLGVNMNNCANVSSPEFFPFISQNIGS